MTEFLSSDPRVPGRTCAGCAMCCFLPSIPELDKPKSAWCEHCSTRQACDIYENRPELCEKFYCIYLIDDQLGEEWKPSISKIMLMPEQADDGTERIVAHVHPQRSDVWKKEPFYSALKQMAVDVVPFRGQVVVYIRDRVIVILPNKDVDLGIVDDDHRIVTVETQSPWGIELDARKIHKDDLEV